LQSQDWAFSQGRKRLAGGQDNPVSRQYNIVTLGFIRKSEEFPENPPPGAFFWGLQAGLYPGNIVILGSHTCRKDSGESHHREDICPSHCYLCIISR
jgi:hypothetical protein